ncbi:MAG: PRC-barrel domain-containing protein [Spirulinaceae cyanobacterium]
MNKQPEITKHSELLNRLVLNRRTTDKIGNVEKIWLDPQAHRVLGLVCKSGLLGIHKDLVAWQQVEKIGEDGIIVNLPTEEKSNEKPEKDEILIGHEIWTDEGTKVGNLVDYLFIPETGEVIGYLFASSGWRGVVEGVYMLTPVAISSVGDRRVIVLATALENPRLYQEGVNHRIEDIKDYFQEDLAQTKQDLRTAIGLPKRVVEQLQDAAESATDKVKDRFKAQPEPDQKEDEKIKDSDLEN